mgnify:CR=1 FL=1
MADVFLIPGSRSHIKSISEGIPLNQIIDIIKSPVISSMPKDQRIRVWGALPTKRSTWRRMKEDDWFLFATSGTGLYEYCGRILTTSHNPKLAEKLEEMGFWPREGRKYEYIIFLKDVRKIAISKKKINEIAGWQSPKLPIQLMRVANPQTAEKIINLVRSEVGIEEQKIDVKDILEKLCDEEPEFSKVIKTSFAHLIAGKNVVFYGPPATSKTYLAKKICGYICGEDNFAIETANAEWSYFDVVGGRVPKEGGGTEFEEGIILRATEKCRRMLEKTGRPYWLIIDELNRANLDLAFGRIFTQIDIDHREEPLHSFVKNRKEHLYFMPLSFRILATMNTYDRSLLFSLGYAFMRRFAFIPVGSLLKEHQEDEEIEELEIIDEMKEFSSSQMMRKLKEKALTSVLYHFSKKNGVDRAFIFKEFEKSDIDEIKNIFNHLRVNELDALDIFLYISSKITNIGLVEIGHAIIFDAAKFMVAYYLLSPEDADAKMLLNEAILALLLPQLEYFMPKLRKGKVFGEKTYLEKWEQIKGIFEKLNLKMMLKKLNEAEEEFRVIS